MLLTDYLQLVPCDMQDFQQDINACLEVLSAGGIILFPTDTVWAIGCDATSDTAVQQVLTCKGLDPGHGLVTLVADERELLQYVANPNPLIFDELKTSERPVTVVYNGIIGLSGLLLHQHGTAAIRIVRDQFCKHLLKRFRKPIVATAAAKVDCIPANFNQIDPAILSAADYVVHYRREEQDLKVPSLIVCYDAMGNRTILRS